ncbi:MAG: LUD domain-containing protein [Candidatus Aminicenantes bacterium]|nr:LUD domain-containing protein [Candidatus Aminicenantes bacterium]
MGRRRDTKKALADARLQNALAKASARHFRAYQETSREPDWRKTKDAARVIRRENVGRLPELIARFREEAEKTGARTVLASTPAEALREVETICRRNGARLIVKAKSMVSEEIGLNAYLEKKGYRVVESDLGEWIVQLAGERPSHITAPALHKTKEDVAALLGRALGRPVPADISEMVRIARQELRHVFFEADVGLSGANLAVAETGTLVIVSNEGNARLVTTLPPVHIALVSAEKFVASLEEAVPLLKALVTASSGSKMTSYVSFITGPSRTTDIEKETAVGVHGPREVHIIILDNGRLRAAKDKDGREILTCLKCGGCMFVCPVFQTLGGHVFGGPVYPGGIGGLLSVVTRSPEAGERAAALCADCKKCEEFCPVGIPTGDLLLNLKERRGPAVWESALSGLFRNSRWQDAAAAAAAFFLSPWRRDGRLRLPRPAEIAVPLPRREKGRRASGIGPGKAYLFQGCLVKHVFPEIRESALDLLPRFGYRAVCPEDQGCCGAPSLHLARGEDVRRLAERNLRSFEREAPDVILTFCPTGGSLLKKKYPELIPEAKLWAGRVRDFTEFMVANGFLPGKKESGRKAFYHHPCHALHELHVRDEPLKLLRSSGFSPRTEPEPFSCCGFCGVFSLKNPDVSARLWQKKEQAIRESGASLIVTDCPGCLLQMKTRLAARGKSPEVRHSAEILREAVCGNRLSPRPESRRPDDGAGSEINQ